MVNKAIILFFCTLLWRGTNAQDDSLFMPAKVFPGDIKDFAVDNLGNLYVLYKDGRLKKMSAEGDSLAVFNEVRRYGKLFSFDVSNPLKILLYYKDFSTIVILDRFLTIRTTIDLRKRSLFQISAIGQSYDNNIWIFDEQDSRLKKISDDGRLIDQFTDFRMLFDSIPLPHEIVDQNQQLYLYDSSKGVYIFDHYGGFKKRLAFTGWSDFTAINNTVLGRDGSFLYKYEPGSLELKKYHLPVSMLHSKKLVILPNRLYLMDEGGIREYLYE